MTFHEVLVNTRYLQSTIIFLKRSNNNNQIQAHYVYFMKKYIICLHNLYIPLIETKILNKYNVFGHFCILTLNKGSPSTNTCVTFAFTYFTIRRVFTKLVYIVSTTAAMSEAIFSVPKGARSLIIHQMKAYSVYSLKIYIVCPNNFI